MNLQIRMNDDRTLVLTTEDGKPLPGQKAVAWNHVGQDSLGEISIDFLIDGTTIAFSTEPVTEPKGSLPEASAAFAALSPENRARFLTMYGLFTRPPTSFEEGMRKAAESVRRFAEAYPTGGTIAAALEAQKKAADLLHKGEEIMKVGGRGDRGAFMRNAVEEAKPKIEKAVRSAIKKAAKS